MPYCKKCGELGRADKCKKCGTILHTSPSSMSQYFNVSHWQSRDVEKKPSFATVKKSPRNKMHEWRKIPSTMFEKKHRIAPTGSVSHPPLSKQSNECAHCHQQLSGKLIQLTDDEESKKYHWSCLLCFECEQPFQSTDLYFSMQQQQQLYHYECMPNSPLLDGSCSHCKRSVLDKYLDVHTSVLHPECFRCTGCQKMLKSASIYCHKDQDQVFCRTCHHVHFPQDQYTITNEAQWKVVPQARQQFLKTTCQLSYHDEKTPPSSSSPTVTTFQQSLTLPISEPVHPSDLINHRRRPLPNFGAVKMCPGCQSTIKSVHDECNGPRATKWHRQCLACSSCRKRLDSSAKVHASPENNLVPTCTTCMLKRKNANQKSNSDFMMELCQ